MTTFHLTPRCHRPVRGQVSLSRFQIDTGTTVLTLPSKLFRLDMAPNPRVVYATDRLSGKGVGLCLHLPVSPESLTTTAYWAVQIPGEQEFMVTHIIQWILPSFSSQVTLTDDVWLWPNSPDTPSLKPGDRPVMDISTQTVMNRKSLTIIDTIGPKERLTRRFQHFPLALAERNLSRLPDTVIYAEAEQD